MYKCKYFTIKELVNPEYLKKYDEDLLWSLFDDRLLKAADRIRELYGVILINSDGIDDAGARLPISDTGSSLSAHKFFRALDLKIVNIEKKADNQKQIPEYNRIRQELLINPEFNFLNFENNISWLHIDTYNRKSRIFNPN